jgi:co-chaperonin GroES (HSP10)
MHTDKLKNIIVVGDRVLIKIKTATTKTRSGLFLPPGYTEKEEVQYGFIVKTGPGYPIPLPGEDQAEPWKNSG